jgi:hypothetical protein
LKPHKRGSILPFKEELDMKRSRFSEEQIVGFLKEVEAGLSVTEACRKYLVFQSFTKKTTGNHENLLKTIDSRPGNREDITGLKNVRKSILVNVTFDLTMFYLLDTVDR